MAQSQHDSPGTVQSISAFICMLKSKVLLFCLGLTRYVCLCCVFLPVLIVLILISAHTECCFLVWQLGVCLSVSKPPCGPTYAIEKDKISMLVAC